MSESVVELETKERVKAKFYLVSPRKFSILFLSTYGVYVMYWMYKNWALYKESTGEGVWPIVRALFPIFFVHSLCKRLRDATSESDGLKGSHLPGEATKYVIITLIMTFTDNLFARDVGSPYLYFVSFILLPFAWQALLNIQKYINRLQGDETGQANNKLTWANYVWIGLGALFWLFVVLGGIVILLG